MKTLLFISLISFNLNLWANEPVKSTEVVAPVVQKTKEEVKTVAVQEPAKEKKNFFDIIEDLKEGNKRFSSGNATHPSQDATTRQGLISSQAPNAVVLTCSDSRVPPELIFDKGIGEIFVVRNAGNIAETISIASIEYAVEHLGSKVLVVMGHDSCGAVKATLGAKKGHSAGSPNLDLLVKNIENNMSYSKGFARDAKNPGGAITANVRGTVVTLMKRSKIIREYVANNKLIIVQALYHFDSGVAEILEIGRPLLVNMEEKTKNTEERASEPERKMKVHEEKATETEENAEAKQH